MQRFKEHGFVISSIDEFTEHSKALDEVLKKLEELQKKNTVLMKKYQVVMLSSHVYINVFVRRTSRESIVERSHLYQPMTKQL